MNDLEQIRERGYVILENLIDAEEIAAIRDALRPHLREHGAGRNNFEGYATERVYGLVGKGAPFARLAEHPRVMAVCDALLEPNYLLTASQAIKIYPGESPQPWHVDDGFYRIPRPRPAISVSTIWAIDPFTADNGATQLVPGSHRWGDEPLAELVAELAREISTRDANRAPRTGMTPDEVARTKIDATMPPGSVIVFVGTLLHRGGENRSAAPRLAVSHQYCEPWARQQENFILAVPPAEAKKLSPKVQSMLGYSIHPPFMGHVGGIHPARLLERD